MNDEALKFLPYQRTGAMTIDDVINITTQRAIALKNLLDTRRDIDIECGYDKTLQPDQYRLMYDREQVAARVVEILPDETWTLQPTIKVGGDSGHPWVKRLLDITADWTVDDESWLEDVETNPLWEYCNRVDVRSGIGSYGVLLLGFQQGANLLEPITPKKGLQCAFARVFDETEAEVVKWNDDKTSRRYGWPEVYSVEQTPRGHDGGSETVEVHWSRVIHVADNLGSSEVLGRPRQEVHWNRLMDLRKLYGGSGEMYWRGAFPGLAAETHPQLGADVEIDVESMRTQMTNYMDTLQRYLAVAGVSWKTLAPNITDPTPHLKAALEAICIKIPCPMRIFLGSERGELASSQDEKAWQRRLNGRRKRYVTPRLIARVINRLIWAGCLEKQAYSVEWPDIEALSPDQRAAIAERRTNAYAKFVAGDVESLIKPVVWLTREMGFDETEARDMINTEFPIDEEDDNWPGQS